MTGPHTQLTQDYNLLQYDRKYEHELLMTNSSIRNQNKHKTPSFIKIILSAKS